MLSLYETIVPCKEGVMQIKINEFDNCCDLIHSIIKKLRAKRRKLSSVEKFEVQFSDLSNMPGKTNATITVKVWDKRIKSEPVLIEHWSLMDGYWSKDS